MVQAVPVSTTVEEVGIALREGDRRDWQRHPVDVARLALRLTLLGLILLITALIPAALTNTSGDLVRLLDRMPEALRYAFTSLAQLAIVAIPIVIMVWLLRSRTRAATLLVVGAGVVGMIVMLLLTDWLARAAPPTEITDLTSGSFLPTDFPSAAYLAALVAGASAASPMLPPFWRKVAWTAIWITMLVRVLSATQAPVNVAVTLALGSAIGSAALVAFGSPQRRPGSATLRAGLATTGFEVDELGDETSARGLRTYTGAANGESIEVVYLDRDDRDVELFARVVRSIRVRDVDEQRISVKPRVRAAQLVMATSMAQRAGSRVPEVLAVAPMGDDSAVVAMASPRGIALRALGADGVSDRALDDLWVQLGRLHDAKMAHRSLSRDHLVLDGDRASLLGMDTAILASSAESRAVDRADLLVSTAQTVGVDRALDAAVRVVPTADLEAALPFVQLPALPAHARREAKKPKHFVDEIRTGLQDRLGVEAVELAELERISFAKLVVWIGFAVLAFFLLTLISNWSDIVDAMTGLDWVWVIPIVLATLGGTVGGAMSLAGSVIRPIPLWPATIIMFGQSFLNRFTPMNAGGMAMRIRYLQKGGTDVTVATAAIGLTSAASGVMQVVFIVFFVLWSSSDPTGDVSTGGGDSGGPNLTLIAVFAGAILVAGIVVAVTPKFRRWLVAFVTSTIEKIRHDFGELARRPSKLGLLFGGAAIAKMSTIVAFVASCRAFDVDIPFAELGAMYLVANTIASTVPTPGGVGAIEAALILVLTNAGVPQATAWAAVLLFRLINYWLPTIPGYVCLKISERRAYV
jgi:uncharacterized membrane protein YbhN (UPF0104 family)/tRNA A-37 threonylcarbamoyl transferase component Bud32